MPATLGTNQLPRRAEVVVVGAVPLRHLGRHVPPRPAIGAGRAG